MREALVCVPFSDYGQIGNPQVALCNLQITQIGRMRGTYNNYKQ